MRAQTSQYSFMASPCLAGKLLTATRGAKKASFRYDYFNRMIEKREGEFTTRYSYSAWGQRTGRLTVKDGLRLEEKRTYDKFGRLVKWCQSW